VRCQVFHVSRLSFAVVNLKPLLPGHVLVSPRRVVPRFNDLSAAEVQDLFLTVQRVSRMVERVFDASSLNIAIQDGVDAGQSVPHVHAHIIPRKRDDLHDQGGTDAIYEMMESEDADLGRQLKEKEAATAAAHLSDGDKRGRFPAVDNDSRKPRSSEEMQEEAEWLADEMAKDEQALHLHGSSRTVLQPLPRRLPISVGFGTCQSRSGQRLASVFGLRRRRRRHPTLQPSPSPTAHVMWGA
jgi:bis(5'-adenosyl)-triphosphatase